MTPSISIITPSYNQGRYIERTIQSVLGQGVREMEYLVMDGGSQDGTIEILHRHQGCLEWVSEADGGHADAVNKGIRRSTGPIIGWLNSDDLYYPGALVTVLDYFKKNPDVDVVYGDAHHIDQNDVFIETYPTEPWNWDRLLETCYISQPAAFLRRSTFERFGPLDTSLRQSIDYEYWVRLGKYGARFEHLPVLLAATRLHPETFTVGARVACHAANNDFLRRHLGRVPEQWIFNYAHAVVETRGFARTDRLRFAVAVSLVSWYASLRWNRRISKGVIRTTAFWIGANARNAVRQQLARPGNTR